MINARITIIIEPQLGQFAKCRSSTGETRTKSAVHGWVPFINQIEDFSNYLNFKMYIAMYSGVWEWEDLLRLPTSLQLRQYKQNYAVRGKTLTSSDYNNIGKRVGMQ